MSLKREYRRTEAVRVWVPMEWAIGVNPGKLTESEGKLLKRLFRMRQTGDYDDTMDWTREDVEPYLPLTHDLINKIRCLINEEIGGD